MEEILTTVHIDGEPPVKMHVSDSDCSDEDAEKKHEMVTLVIAEEGALIVQDMRLV